MSTDSTSDIFYQVKKQILDKLDIILQKVNLQIINSRHFKSIQKDDSEFTFIQLSNFQSEISTLFVYLDKLYDSLNSSVSGYTSQAHHTNAEYNQIYQLNEKLQIENQSLKKQMQKLNKQIIRLSEQVIKQQDKNNSLNISNKSVRQRIAQISNILRHQHQQINILRKQISGKLKQYKFQMLETRVEILTKIKECDSFWKQASIRKEDPQINCHHISHDEFQIINQLNQILKMC